MAKRGHGGLGSCGVEYRRSVTAGLPAAGSALGHHCMIQGGIAQTVVEDTRSRFQVKIKLGLPKDSPSFHNLILEQQRSIPERQEQQLYHQ